MELYLEAKENFDRVTGLLLEKTRDLPPYAVYRVFHGGVGYLHGKFETEKHELVMINYRGEGNFFVAWHIYRPEKGLFGQHTYLLSTTSRMTGNAFVEKFEHFVLTTEPSGDPLSDISEHLVIGRDVFKPADFYNLPDTLGDYLDNMSIEALAKKSWNSSILSERNNLLRELHSEIPLWKPRRLNA